MAAILLLVMTLTGCNESMTNENQNRTEITFSWWGNDDRHAYTMDGIDIFCANNPEIAVDYIYGQWSGYERKNNVWMESCTEADVMQINYAWLTTYSADGEGYYDLNELTDYIDLSGFDDTDLRFGTINGKLNGIPIAYNASVICFDSAIFDEYNLDYPKTWDDLFDVAKVLSKHDIYVLGAPKKHLLLLLIAYYEQTYNETVFNEDGTLNIDKEGMGKMLDFYKRLLDEKVLMPIDKFDRSILGTGECAGSAFWISDADNYCQYIENGGGAAVFVPYFMADDATMTGMYMKPATMYAISNITDNPVESAKLLNFLINDQEMILLQGTEKGVPANDNAVELLRVNDRLLSNGYSGYSIMEENKELYNIMIPAMESEAIIDAFKQTADAYIYNVQDRDTTVEQIYDAVLELTK